MAEIAVNRINNCNIYVDGIGLIGRAEEIEVPQVKTVMQEHKGLGMWGKAEFPAGADKLEAKIKWASIYAEAEQLKANPFIAHQFQVRGDLMVWTSQGLSQELPLVYLMTGVFRDGGKLAFKHMESVDATSELSVYHAELYIEGEQIFLYDVMSNTYVANGVDLLAQFRANLGG